MSRFQILDAEAEFMGAFIVIGVCAVAVFEDTKTHDLIQMSNVGPHFMVNPDKRAESYDYWADHWRKAIAEATALLEAEHERL